MSQDSDRLTAVFADALCAVDGTHRSYAAVEQAAALVGPAGQLKLLAVTAVVGTGPYRSASISSSRSKQILSKAQQIAEAAGVKAVTVVDPGRPPSEVILKTATEHDLLTLGAPIMPWPIGKL